MGRRGGRSGRSATPGGGCVTALTPCLFFADANVACASGETSAPPLGREGRGGGRREASAREGRESGARRRSREERRRLRNWRIGIASRSGRGAYRAHLLRALRSYAAPAMFVSQTNPRRRRGGRSRAGCDDGGEEGFGVNGFRRGLVPAAAPQSARSSYKRVNAQVCPVPSEGRPRYAETIIIIRK